MHNAILPPPNMAYVQRLQKVMGYVYFAREWFLEGPNGECGRTAVVIFTKTALCCYHFGAVDVWCYQDRQKHVVQSHIFFDTQWSCNHFNTTMESLVSWGILDITEPESQHNTAHFFDCVGVSCSPDQHHWYWVVGAVHNRDNRYEQHIAPFFTGPSGIGPYLEKQDVLSQ